MDAPALLGTINNTTTASSYVSGTCTPTNATKTIFALVTGRRGTGAQLPAVTGMGLTWEPLGGGNVTNSNTRYHLFRGYGTPSAGAVTVTFANSHLACQAHIFETDAAEVRQVVTATGSGTDTSITLASFAASGADSTVISAHYAITDDAATATGQGGLTVLSELQLSGDNVVSAVLVDTNLEDTTPGATLAVSSAWSGVAVELVPLPADGAVVYESYTSGSAAASYSTASYTPPSGVQTYAVVRSLVSTGTANQPTLTGNGLTWTNIATHASGVYRITLCAASLDTPSADTLDADFGGQNQTDCTIIVFTVPDTDGTAVQSAGAGNTNTTAAVTLSGFSDAANVALFAAYGNHGDAFPWEARDGLRTIIAADMAGAADRPVLVGYLRGEDLTPSAVYGTTGTNWIALGVELQTAQLPLIPITTRVVGQFWRNNEGNLHLITLGFGLKWGIQYDDPVSDPFVFNAGTHDAIMSEMEAVWATDSTADTAALRAAINNRLNRIGYRGVDRELLPT